MRAVVLALALACAGCSSMIPETETIFLAKGDERVQCGPYRPDLMADDNMGRAESNLRNCVEDYQTQGFKRVPR